MLNQFNLYIILALILALVATSGGFLLYRRITLAEIAVLEQRNATLTLAVDQQTKTIEQMVKDAEALANANKFLSDRMTATEAAFVDEWSAIEALDLGRVLVSRENWKSASMTNLRGLSTHYETQQPDKRNPPLRRVLSLVVMSGVD
ncbi:hypothetical protein FB009_11782 [Sinorhizobium medicae]|uniref:hypothetical protein n=1 Tax=Sinorhizobium medicae TaxID=110321 RepID=UPI00119AD7E7|nr:hypothetical protein [Sinorhizobium medicae]MQU78054.1 hypothetical protein [Sinorhizobium medicae]TWA34073.1 hypothetical protein FB009_11782 [Sinorhizobium medicae]